MIAGRTLPSLAPTGADSGTRCADSKITRRAVARTPSGSLQAVPRPSLTTGVRHASEHLRVAVTSRKRCVIYTRIASRPPPSHADLFCYDLRHDTIPHGTTKTRHDENTARQDPSCRVRLRRPPGGVRQGARRRLLQEREAAAHPSVPPREGGRRRQEGVPVGVPGVRGVC